MSARTLPGGCLAALTALSFCALASAQDDTFDVASVRVAAPAQPNQPFMRLTGGPGTNDPEHVRWVGIPMLQLLARTYGMQADQFVAPAWAIEQTRDAVRYDIVANVRPGATKAQLNTMVENLLKERFHFVYHREKRDFEVYELVVAKGGSKLKDAEIPAEIPTVPAGPLQVNSGADGYPSLAPGYPMIQGASSRGGRIFMTIQDGFVLAPGANGGPSMGDTKFTLRMVTTQQLVNFAQNWLGSSHAVDHAGLSGKYDVKVEFMAGSGSGFGPQGAGSNEASDPAPDVFTAFEKQLGLKFQKTKAPLDVIVIDRLDKTASEN